MAVGAQRSGGEPVRVAASPGDDVVVLTIANGPRLVLHPEDARDLLLAQKAGATRSAVQSGGGDEVAVSTQLGWPGLEAGLAGATRGAAGWMGQAMLSTLDVIERQSLLGSGYKRLSMLEWTAGRKPQAQAALEKMVNHYEQAEKSARASGAINAFYPAKHAISAELRSALLKGIEPAGRAAENGRHMSTMSYCPCPIAGSACSEIGLPMKSDRPARCGLSSSSSISTTVADAITRNSFGLN